MKVYLDNELIEAPVGEGDSALAAALTEGVKRAEAAQRIVIEVHADGRALEGDELNDPGSAVLDAEELRLTTAEPTSLVTVTLGDAAEGMGEAAPKHQEIAEAIQGGDTPEAMEALGEVLGMWQAARQAVESGSAVLGRDLLAEVDGGEAMMVELAKQLAELQSALAGEDWSTAADVLAYDLGPQAEKFAGTLRSAADRLGG